MMAANHCLISIGVKKQSESQHHGLFVRLFGALKLFRSKGGSAWFTQLWRLVLWQFLQLTAHECPQNHCSDRIELRELQLIPHLLSSEFWLWTSSTSGFPLHFAQAVASTSTRTWRSTTEPWSSATAAAGGTAWSPKSQIRLKFCGASMREAWFSSCWYGLPFAMYATRGTVLLCVVCGVWESALYNLERVLSKFCQVDSNCFLERERESVCGQMWRTGAGYASKQLDQLLYRMGYRPGAADPPFLA